MTNFDQKKKDEKQEKLAKALRENMKRRKAQQKASKKD